MICIFSQTISLKTSRGFFIPYEPYPIEIGNNLKNRLWLKKISYYFRRNWNWRLKIVHLENNQNIRAVEHISDDNENYVFEYDLATSLGMANNLRVPNKIKSSLKNLRKLSKWSRKRFRIFCLVHNFVYCNPHKRQVEIISFIVGVANNCVTHLFTDIAHCNLYIVTRRYMLCWALRRFKT